MKETALVLYVQHLAFTKAEARSIVWRYLIEGYAIRIVEKPRPGANSHYVIRVLTSEE